MEILALAAARQAVESAGQAVQDTKEQLVKPKQEDDSSKVKAGASDKDAKNSGIDAETVATQNSRGSNVNIET